MIKHTLLYLFFAGSPLLAMHSTVDDNNLYEGSDLKEGDFFVLQRVNNPLDDTFGTQPDSEVPIEIDTTMLLMRLAEELIQEYLPSDTKTQAQASLFGANAIKKKSEKKEQRVQLINRLKLYEAEIKNALEEKKQLEKELERHNERLQEELAALKICEHEELLGQKNEQLLSMHDVPETVATTSAERKEKLKERKAELEDEIALSKVSIERLTNKLSLNVVTMKKLQEQNDLSAKEKKAITNIIARLDEALIRIAVKHKTISPDVALDSLREHTLIAVDHPIKEQFDEKFFEFCYVDQNEKKSLYRRFCELIRWQK